MQSLGSFDDEGVRPLYKKNDVSARETRLPRFTGILTWVQIWKYVIRQWILSALPLLRNFCHIIPGSRLCLLKPEQLSRAMRDQAGITLSIPRESYCMISFLPLSFLVLQEQVCAGTGNLMLIRINYGTISEDSKRAIKGINPVDEKFIPSRSESGNLRIYQLKGKKTILLWLRDMQ